MEIMTMKTAAIAKLKATLSKYIDYVKSGEEIMITDRGKPVARIIPIIGGISGEARRMSLIRRGIIRPGKGSVSRDLLLSLPVVNIPQVDIDRIIREEREDRI
jgi:prevent-host-death family protein